MDDLIAAVRKHAVENYNEDGWDYLVETYNAEEVAELIGDATTIEEAIARAKKVMLLLNDRRIDIKAEAF